MYIIKVDDAYLESFTQRYGIETACKIVAQQFYCIEEAEARIVEIKKYRNCETIIEEF